MCPQLMSAWAVADWGAKSQAGCGWRAMDDAPRRAPSGLQRFEGRSGSMGFGPVGSMGRAPPPCPCTAPCTRSMSSWRPKAFLAFLASVATAPSASAGGAENHRSCPRDFQAKNQKIEKSVDLNLKESAQSTTLATSSRPPFATSSRTDLSRSGGPPLSSTHSRPSSTATRSDRGLPGGCVSRWT